jgi:hypothetical protein
MLESYSQVTRSSRASGRIVITLVVLTLGIAGFVFAEYRKAGAGKSWLELVKQAEQLKEKDDEASFEVLLQLLGHQHPDVKNAAAEALAARGQSKWSQRIALAVSKMDRNDRWLGYKALAAYPTKDTLIFLADALKDEFGKIPDKEFDIRNYFYISQSIDQIVQKLEDNTSTTTQPAGHSK